MPSRDLFFDEGTPLLKTLSAWNLELDQKLSFALSWASENLYDVRPAINDAELLTGLIKGNASLVRLLGLTPDSWEAAFAQSSRGPYRQASVSPDKILTDLSLCGVLDTALSIDKENLVDRKDKTVGTGKFLRALAILGLRFGDNFDARPFSVDTLIVALGGDRKQPLSAIPHIGKRLRNLYESAPIDEDFQYFLALENNRLVFRVASTVDDFVQAGDSNVLVPQRAMLSHLGNFGLFSVQEVEELETLLNSSTTKETDLQAFFEQHPHFLRKMGSPRSISTRVLDERSGRAADS